MNRLFLSLLVYSSPLLLSLTLLAENPDAKLRLCLKKAASIGTLSRFLIIISKRHIRQKRYGGLSSLGRDVITGEALSEAQETLHHADRLSQGNVNYLLRSQHFFMRPVPYSSASFSGQMSRYIDPSTLLPEGETQKAP